MTTFLDVMNREQTQSVFVSLSLSPEAQQNRPFLREMLKFFAMGRTFHSVKPHGDTAERAITAAGGGNLLDMPCAFQMYPSAFDAFQRLFLDTGAIDLHSMHSFILALEKEEMVSFVGGNFELRAKYTLMAENALVVPIVVAYTYHEGKVKNLTFTEINAFGIQGTLAEYLPSAINLTFGY